MRLLVTCLVIGALVAACGGTTTTTGPSAGPTATPGAASLSTAAPGSASAGPTAPPSASTGPSDGASAAPTAMPSPSAGPSATASGPPTSAPTAVPTATPSPMELLIRVDSTDETDVVPYPDISYYADGRVIAPGREVGRVEVRTLTADGLALVVERVRASALVGRDRTFSALLPDRGVAAITLRTHLPGSEPVTVRAFVNATPAGDTQAFLDFAALLADPAAWLPSQSWATPSAAPYEPAFMRVTTAIEDVADPPPWPADIESVVWPLAVKFDGIGDVIAGSDGYVLRCGVLPIADATALRAALLDAGALRDADWTGTIPLRYGAERAISYSFLSQLPDGVPACLPETADPGWALDGEIAFVRTGADPIIRLWGAPDGSQPIIARGESPAWSPDGSRLAVIRPRPDDLPDLWVVEVDGGAARRIVRTAVSASWSPAGDRLAVSRSPVDVGDLWLVRPDGTGLRELREGGGQVAWSPDGERLAVVTGTASPMVGVLDVRTGERTDLAAGTDPVWTGEARPRIAYVEWGSGHLAVVDPETGVSTSLPASPGPIEHLIRIESPAAPGWALAFVSNGAAWVLDDLAGSSLRLSAPGEIERVTSAVSGGGWVIGVVSRPGETDLVALQADGDGWFQLTEYGDVTDAAARPAP